MTLQPFCIVHSNNNLKGKYHFFDHRGSELAIYKKIPKNFLDKLLSYPITAFGYRFVDLDTKNINPKFDRTDVIKALDFWIEYWVYQNKKDYILEGTVNKDFELTVRELIEFREAVLKMPADTQFVRQKIRVSEVITQCRYEDSDDITKIPELIKDEIVQFTENVLDGGNSSASTVDQFCYVVRKMTYKEYMDQKKDKPYATGQGLFDWTENFRGNNRFDFGDIQRAASFANENTIVGTAAETLNPGDIVISDENGRWRRARSGNDDEMPASMRGGSHTDNPIHSPNFDPNIPATPALGTEQQSLVFEPMIVTDINNDILFPSDPNRFMTVPIRFFGSGAEITMNMMISSSQFDVLSRPFTNHIIRITPGSQNPVLIDGQNYNATDINISYNPSTRPLSGYVFRDLWVQSVSFSGRRLEIEFRGNIGIISEIGVGLEINLPEIDWSETLHHIRDHTRRWDLEIIGNNRVRIGNDTFTVREPINITIR